MKLRFSRSRHYSRQEDIVRSAITWKQLNQNIKSEVKKAHQEYQQKLYDIRAQAIQQFLVQKSLEAKQKKGNHAPAMLYERIK